MNEIQKYLFENQDLKYRDFHSSLVTNVGKEKFIGVRIPILRKYAKELVKANKYKEFIKNLPHDYLDENLLHSCILSELRNFDELINEIELFLPYVDNWSVCDSIKPKVLKKNSALVRNKIYKWLNSKDIYAVRYALVVLLNNYLDDDFSMEDIKHINKVKNDDYYIKMAIAWYYSFALIKQYENVIYIFEEKTLDKWIHNKSIQKAIESYRIIDARKNYLRSLKIK